MKPRIAASVITPERFARDVHRTDAERWKSLAPQWRGFVMQHFHEGHTVDAVIDRIHRDGLKNTLDPQGTFDAFQGNSPL